MKKIVYLCGFFAFNLSFAQFVVSITPPKDYVVKEAYLYTLDGSKDMLSTKEIKKENGFSFSQKTPYIGMLRVYFPETNESFNFISENKNVQIIFETKNKKISKINYLDEANFLMNNAQDKQRKLEQIYPTFLQIKKYYYEDSDFGKALDKEINNLSSKSIIDADKFPFTSYYLNNYEKFISKTPIEKSDIIQFINTSNSWLESSSLLKPLLVRYLNATTKQSIDTDIENLLKTVNVETPRGQVVLSELIEIFDIYDINDLKEKYLLEAKNLKCTINSRLSNTITTNDHVAIGAKFPNTFFKNAKNTTAKSIYDVKADKKIILFWASTCSHCEKELPEIIQNYNDLKKKNIEVIGLSLDTEKEAYENKVNSLPWINVTELKGWDSTYPDLYNVHATPTFYILDSQNKIISKPDNFAEVLSFLKTK